MNSIRCSVFIATSLDGFIARLDGGIDWLPDAETVGDAAPPGEDTGDFGYAEFLASIDCLVMGRNSMEKVLSFPEWPYDGKRVVVLSTSLREAPAALAGKVAMYSGSPTALVSSLAAKGDKRLYIDGGKTVQSFINESLITDLVITRLPILLGEGLPLFGKTPTDIHLKHIASKGYSNGFVQSKYEVIRTQNRSGEVQAKQ